MNLVRIMPKPTQSPTAAPPAPLPQQARQRDVAFRIEDAIHLRPARLRQNRHARLGNLSILQGLGQLPGHDLRDVLRLRFLEDVFLFQEVVDV
jgi:hypothetical protein